MNIETTMTVGKYPTAAAYGRYGPYTNASSVVVGSLSNTKIYNENFAGSNYYNPTNESYYLNSNTFFCTLRWYVETQGENVFFRIAKSSGAGTFTATEHIWDKIEVVGYGTYYKSNVPANGTYTWYSLNGGPGPEGYYESYWKVPASSNAFGTTVGATRTIRIWGVGGYYDGASPSAPNGTIAYGSSSTTVNWTNYDTDGRTSYAVLTTYYANPTNAQIVAGRLNGASVSGNTFSVPSSAYPPAGGSQTYYIYKYRYFNGGGEQLYHYASSFTLTYPLVYNITPDETDYKYTETDTNFNATFTYSHLGTASTIYWKVFRDTGNTDGGNEISPSSGSVSAGTSVSFAIIGDNIDETGWQGETFHLQFFEDSGFTKPISPPTASFYIYDDDVTFTIAPVNSTLAYDATEAKFTVTNNGVQGLQPNSRIYNVSQGVEAVAIVDLPASGNTETYTTSVIPAQGASNSYRLDVWNGNELLPGPTVTVSRDSAPVDPGGGPIDPPDPGTASYGLEVYNADGIHKHIISTKGMTNRITTKDTNGVEKYSATIAASADPLTIQCAGMTPTNTDEVGLTYWDDSAFSGAFIIITRGTDFFTIDIDTSTGYNGTLTVNWLALRIK